MHQRSITIYDPIIKVKGLMKFAGERHLSTVISVLAKGKFKNQWKDQKVGGQMLF
jgi:hypothetical protein